MNSQPLQELIQHANSARRPELIDSLRALNVTLETDSSPSHVQTILVATPLPSFFALLEEDDDALTEVLCSVISKLLANTSYKEIIEGGMQDFLSQGLQHFYPDVRMLALKQSEKSLSSDNEISLMVNSEIFFFIIVTLSFREARVANFASELLFKLAMTHVGQKVFLGAQSTSILSELLQVNETVKFRIYELITRVVVSSTEAFNMARATGLLDKLILDLKSSDLLVKLNAIELVSQIACTRVGYQYLEQIDELKEITALLPASDDGNMTSILVRCAVLKFYGRMSDVEDIDFSAVQEKYEIFNQLNQAIEDANLEIRATAITIVGNVGSSPRGLRLIHSTNSGKQLLAKFMEIYHSSAGDLKITTLQSLSSIFNVSMEPPQDLSVITAEIYNEMTNNRDPLSNLINNAKQPVEALRVASFSVMQAIAYYHWGRKEMISSNEFIDYILDRTTESTHAGKTWKFSIVQTLAAGLKQDVQKYAETVPRGVWDRLESFIRQGPFQVSIEAAVAVENM